MSLQEDLKRKAGQEENSLRERANKSLIRRRREVRAKLILLNSALALIVIMVVLVCKVVSLNKENDNTLPVAENTDSKTSKDKKEEPEDKKKEETPKTTRVPETVDALSTGTDRWIRKDLDANKPMVALTFDDGPYAPVTNRILATLKKYDAKATFFCVGNRIPNYSDVVKKAYNQGCQIASHTYEHKILTSAKKKQIVWQLKKTDKVLDNLIGCHTTALRPPGGCVNDKVRETVDVPMVCWNIDSEDWKSRNVKKILQRCNSIEDGDIVLMHDLYPTTASAIDKLVPRLRKKGFQLVTVDELFYYKKIKAEAGTVYFSGK